MDIFEYMFLRRLLGGNRGDDDGIVDGYFRLMMFLVLIFFLTMLLSFGLRSCDGQYDNPAEEKSGTEQPVAKKTQSRKPETKPARQFAEQPKRPIATQTSTQTSKQQQTVSKNTGSSKKAADAHYFELSTQNGVIKLFTGIHKDSVKSLMGQPHSVRVTDMGSLGVSETWEYMGRNKYVSEFTIMFNDGKLISLHQYREK